jgi:hypothetical protein
MRAEPRAPWRRLIIAYSQREGVYNLFCFFRLRSRTVSTLHRVNHPERCMF